MSLSVVVLAAGQGVRMHSALPKVLHPIGGKAIIEHILSTVSKLNNPRIVVVYGAKGEQLQAALAHHQHLSWAAQEQQLGTGHAALQALSYLADSDRVLILYGDVPLISEKTLTELLTSTPKDGIGLITVQLENPTGLGRIVRDSAGKLQRVVEEKDATAEEKKLTEINCGFFLVPKQYLQQWLPKLSSQNAQKEYYLTDILTRANEQGVSITTVSPEYSWEVMGVNDKCQLAELERIYQWQQAKKLMQQGVMLLDPARFDVRGNVQVGQEVVIDANVILSGQVSLGSSVKIGPNVMIKDTVIEEGAEILANSVIENATIGKGCVIGPFARIRPGTVLAEKSRIGNFVEIKNATVGTQSKINHLSYIGDATIGNKVNIGAGTITCNFDGKQKHQTVIGDHVSIGSDTQLIAPVTVGEGVTIGAGTTVTKDVPAKHLIHNRVEQRIIANWAKAEEE